MPHPYVNIPVCELLATPDGKGFVSFGLSPDVTEWRWDGTRVRSFGGHEENVAAVAFHGDRVITAGGKTVHVWRRLDEGGTCEQVAGFTAPHRAICLAVTGDGSYALSIHGEQKGWGAYRKLHVWNLEKARQSSATDCSADLIDVAGNRVLTARHSGPNHSANAWDIERAKPQCIALFEGMRDNVQNLALTRDGKLAVCTTMRSEVLVFDVASKKLVRRIAGQAGYVRGLALVANDTRVVTAGSEGLVLSSSLVDGTSTKVKGLAHSLLTGSLSVSADGRLAAIVDLYRAQLVDLHAGKLLREWPAKKGMDAAETQTGCLLGPRRLAVATSTGDVAIHEHDES